MISQGKRMYEHPFIRKSLLQGILRREAVLIQEKLLCHRMVKIGIRTF